MPVSDHASEVAAIHRYLHPVDPACIADAEELGQTSDVRRLACSATETDNPIIGIGAEHVSEIGRQIGFGNTGIDAVYPDTKGLSGSHSVIGVSGQALL